ncbi:MAG: site-specific integrase [Ruminococcus flavefaciens]|nr:site-specific integrase [Ruminococcus flavefaciens]
MKNVNSSINQEFIFYLSENGRLDKKGGLAAKTVKDIFDLWISIVKDAAKENYLNLNTEKYKYPKNDRKKIKCLTREQQNDMMKMLEQNLVLYNIGILLALTTGMRIGEICALQWKEINLETQTVAITKTLQRIYTKNGNKGSSQVIITPPKSQNSIRIIPLPSKITQILKEFQNSNDTFFLTGKTDRYTEPRVYREYYNRLMRRNHMLYVSFHGLRHTFATRCIEAGCDYKTLSEILGHADVSTTMRLYVHSDLKKKRECIEKTQSFIYS